MAGRDRQRQAEADRDRRGKNRQEHTEIGRDRQRVPKLFWRQYYQMVTIRRKRQLSC